MTWDELQNIAVEKVFDAINRDVRRILLVGPTGCGKSRITTKLIDRYCPSVTYTNRKILIDQLLKVFSVGGRSVGVRAAGHEDNRHLDVQISSIPTENARTIKKDGIPGGWALHRGAVAIVDEIHLNNGAVGQEIMRRHYEDGAAVIGLTATPLDIAPFFDEMIIAGTNSQFRAVGALVPAMHYGPDEPDMKSFSKIAASKLDNGNDLTDKEIAKAIMTPTIFARVLEWFGKLNPDCKPTMLFGPGVKESIYFAEQFVKAGITAAHIDGENVWVNGEIYKTSKNAREDVFDAAKEGRIKVLCNRFVMREGLDLPFIRHVIGATIFGSLQTYIQSLGRGLRADHDPNTIALFGPKKEVTIQDHGGNWHRHGSINVDREWSLDSTARVMTGLRRERLRSKEQREPCRCPQCGMVLACTRCRCGYEVAPNSRSRPVIEIDGTMKPMVGDIYKPRRLTKIPNAMQIWEKMYYRSRNTDRTFLAAEALFAVENKWGWPSREFPLMPIDLMDMFNKVRDVPRERLR